MARKIQGRLFTRGCKDYYYIQFYLNGKQIVKALRDEDNKPITGLRAAKKAASIILAPYQADDEVQRRQQASDALKTAEDKAKDAERIKNAIRLTDAFERAMDKPRRRPLGERAKQHKEANWNDFIAYINDNHPSVKTIDQITQSHAEQYIQYLTQNGKYNKQITYKQHNKVSTYKSKIKKLSPKSINYYLINCRDVFKSLMDDAGITVDPFAKIPKVKQVQESREAFTEEELDLIWKTADEFILSLFTVGLCTGLREADICLLEWNDIDLDNGFIKRVTRKTNKTVMIPILPRLRIFLEEQRKKEPDSVYVLPEHAQIYKTNPTGISWRVKKFLKSIDIATSKNTEGRSRAVSTKDVHSLRHTFCYLAGKNNIPLAIVQAVVGHMSPEMTKHYTQHASQKDIKAAFLNMPNIFDSANQTVQQLPEPAAEPERQQLRQLVDILPIKDIRRLLKSIKM